MIRPLSWTLALILAAACEPPFHPPAVVATVSISPDSVTVRWGASRTLTATVRDSSGAELRDVVVVWSSSQPTQVQVTQDGVVHALQPGNATISARAHPVTGSATVVVSVPVTTVTLPVPDYRLVPGSTMQLSAALADSLGRALHGRTVTWVSSDTTVAAIDAAGVLSGRAAGVASLMVTSEGVADTAVVRVTPARLTAVRPGLGPHTCALADDGRPFCWGANDLGELGNGQPTDALGPTGVAGGHRLAGLGGGGHFNCGSDLAGNAWCWGNGARGRLGNGSLQNSAVPVAVAGARTYRAFATGWSHSCALAGPIGAWCWGGGTGLGGDPGKQSSMPLSLSVPDSLVFAEVSAGDGLSCGLTADGAAYCWGETPLPVQGGHAFVALTLGTGHGCGLTSDGAAWCWGVNANGQLGDGTTNARNIPVAVTGAPAFRAITAGADYTCALTPADEAWCWGANTRGQLGDGTTASSTVPIRAAATLSFTSLAAGASHTCGIAADARAWCWGANQAGQLGDGTKTDRPAPVRVAGQP